MKKTILLLAGCFALASCGQNNKKNVASEENNAIAEVVEYASDDAEDWEEEATPTGETLNDIRFAGWGKKEWADNDYIRAVRKYIDAYNSGEIKNPDLDEQKKYIQGKFAIADIQPYLTGGALIYIIFYDNPEQTFSAHVYSDVDEKTRVVSNYECRGLKNENMDLEFSQEDILQFLKECPEHRLW